MAKISKFGGVGGTGGSFNLGSIFGGNSLGGLTKTLAIASGITALLGALTKAKSNSSIQNYRYRYNVTKFQMIFPGEEAEPKEIIGNAIKMITATWLYDECIHPTLEMNVMLPPKLYNKIIDNKDKVKAVLRIQRTAYDETNSPVVTKDWINGEFGFILDNEVKYTEEQAHDEKSKQAPGEYNEADYNTPFNLSLWKQNDLDAMRKVVNTIVNNADVGTAMRTVFGEANFNKIVMSPLDNNAKYDQIIIMPTNLMNIPDYFEKAYGTYYTGTQMFCDFDRLYILSKNGICDAFEDGEYKRTIFVIKGSQDPDSKKAGTAEDKQSKVYYMYVNTGDVDTQTPSSSSDLIEGNNVTIINSNSNQTMEVGGAGNQNGAGNNRVITDNYGNDFNKSTVLSDINEKNGEVTVYTSDYNLEALTPNKEILVVFEEKDKQSKNGFYRIKSSTAILGKEDHDLMSTGKHVLVFKRALTSDESNQILVSITKKNNLSNIGGASNIGSKAMDTAGGSGSSGAAASANNVIEDKVKAPIPRFQGMDAEEIISSTNVTPNDVPKNPNFNYDDLGNVKGVDIPEYNRITEDDDNSVRRAKQEAQAKLLPSETPQPRKLIG